MFKYLCVIYCFILIYTAVPAQEQSKISSLSLKDAIDIALRNHPEIHKAKYSIESSKGRYLKDISLPPLSLSITNEFIPKGSGLSNYDEKTIEISQGFDFPTTYFSRGSKASAETNAYEAGFNAITNYIRTSVKRAYYTALAKYQLLKIAEENNSIANEFFKKAEIRFKVGEGTNLELLTSKVQLAEAKSLIEISKKEYYTALEELHNSIAYSKDVDFANIKFLDSLSYKSYNFSIEELTRNTLLTSPYIKKASYELESAEISKKIAWMNLIPSFNASYMFQSRVNSPNYYGERLGLSFPIWFMFDQNGRIQEANANFQINNYELQYVKNNIIQKINSNYIDFINDEKQLSLYQNELVPQAEEIFRTASLSYQVGEITYLEFLQAKFTTINARINLVKSLFNFKEAIINLEESTGLNLE